VEIEIFMEITLLSEMENLVAEFRESSILLDPLRLRERSAWLDRLDALSAEIDRLSAGTSSPEGAMCREAKAMGAELETVNERLYAELRAAIREGSRPALFSQLARESVAAGGPSFDYLDELIAGVLGIEEPDPPPAHPGPELVFYQPTPARHIFQLLRLACLNAADTLIDLGSGLGHVPLVASICTDAQCVGIEREEAYVACARHCLQRLSLKRVTFQAQDARAADLSAGTVFYLYTPFTGSVLSDVLERLRQESRSRVIRICTFGPCADAVAREAWLAAEVAPTSDRITVFRARA
jgi:predicted O-methyltransferase YrrM